MGYEYIQRRRKWVLFHNKRCLSRWKMKDQQLKIILGWILSLNSAWLHEITSQRKRMVFIFTCRFVVRTQKCIIGRFHHESLIGTGFISSNLLVLVPNRPLIPRCNPETEDLEGLESCGEVVELSVSQKTLWEYECIL